VYPSLNLSDMPRRGGGPLIASLDAMGPTYVGVLSNCLAVYGSGY
jgi:hypothetical protein